MFQLMTLIDRPLGDSHTKLSTGSATVWGRRSSVPETDSARAWLDGGPILGPAVEVMAADATDLDVVLRPRVPTGGNARDRAACRAVEHEIVGSGDPLAVQDEATRMASQPPQIAIVVNELLDVHRRWKENFPFLMTFPDPPHEVRRPRQVREPQFPG